MKICNAMYSITIVCVSFVVVCAAVANRIIIAKALFYTDNTGRVLLATGDIPTSAFNAIRYDIQKRLHENVTVKITPVFPKITNIPLNVNIMDYLRTLHPTVYVAEVPRRLSRNLLKEMWFHIVHKRQGKIDKTHGINIDVSEPVQLTTTTERSTRRTTTRQLGSQEDFVPNDIFYSIEKKCTNWADGCDRYTGSFMNMTSDVFHIPLVYKRPKIINWDP